MGDDGEPKFNERLNYCSDCTQAKRSQMQAMGRCNPFHLSDNPDPPDSRTAATTRLGGGAGAGAAPLGKVTPLLLPGDAFTRLVGYLMVLGQRPVAWARA